MLEAACLTPQRHYSLALGQLRVGDPFNAALVDNLRDFTVRATWLAGRLAAETARAACRPCLANRSAASPPARCARGTLRCPIRRRFQPRHRRRGWPVADPQLRLPLQRPSIADDVLLIAVVNRYRRPPRQWRWCAASDYRPGAGLQRRPRFAQRHRRRLRCGQPGDGAQCRHRRAGQPGPGRWRRPGRLPALPIAGLMRRPGRRHRSQPLRRPERRRVRHPPQLAAAGAIT